MVPVPEGPLEVREEGVELGVGSCDDPEHGPEDSQHCTGEGGQHLRVEVLDQFNRSDCLEEIILTKINISES